MSVAAPAQSNVAAPAQSNVAAPARSNASAPVRLSIVVLSRHRPGLLALCLTALSQQDHPEYEVILVADPASVDTRPDLRIKRIAFDLPNVSAARNIGLGAAAGEVVRVPAAEVIHVIDPVEGGQLRGVSKLAPAIVKLFLLDQYDDAELDRKKVAAMYAMFVTSPAPENPLAPAVWRLSLSPRSWCSHAYSTDHGRPGRAKGISPGGQGQCGRDTPDLRAGVAGSSRF